MPILFYHYYSIIRMKSSCEYLYLFQELIKYAWSMGGLYNIDFFHSNQMSEKEEADNSECFYCLFFVVACLATGSAITTTILLYLWGYFGFDYTPALTFSNCLTNYHIAKLGDLNTINQVIFISSCIASLTGLLSTIIVLTWLVKRCKQLGSPSLCSKIILYLMVSLLFMASIVPFGYYLTFQIEGSQCTKTVSDQFQLIIILTLAIITFVLSLFFWLFLLCHKGQDSAEKYKEISSHYTQPNRQEKRDFKVPENQKYFSKPREIEVEREEYRPRYNIRQETKENIFSPKRQVFERYESTVPRFIPRNKDENPVYSLHPTLDINKDKEYEYGRMMEEKKVSYKDYLVEDERTLRDQERKHYYDYDRSRPVIQNDRYRDSPRNRRGRENRERYDDRNQDEDNDRDYRDRPRRNRRDYIDNDRRNNRGRSPPREERRDDRNYMRDQDPPRKHKQSPPRTLREEAMLRVLTKP